MNSYQKHLKQIIENELYILLNCWKYSKKTRTHKGNYESGYIDGFFESVLEDIAKLSWDNVLLKRKSKQIL